MKNIFIILLFVLITFGSCEDYLDDKTNKTSLQEIETTKDIELLLDNTRDPFDRNVVVDVNFVNISDDYYLYPEPYKALSQWIGYDVIQGYTWENEITSPEDKSWANSYKAIWLANYIITRIDGLEGRDEDKANLIAEAHLIKAYKLLALAMKHCLYPSDNNLREMGLPLKNSIEFEDLPARSNLQETFQAIENHLTEGFKINKERTSSWRESKASAAALAARYYLYVHDFQNAKKYAEMAISKWNYMVNMETSVIFTKLYDKYDLPSTARFQSYYKDFFTIWDSQIKLYYTEWEELLPSADLLNLYEPEDMRLKFYSNFILEHYVGLLENNLMYKKFEGAIMSGPDVAEMYLILAECAARNGDFAACMQNIEEVRVNRFKADDYITLPIPTSIKEAVQLVVDERRREFPFSFARWSDLKRLNNEGLLDPIILKREFFTHSDGSVNMESPKVYTLEPNSRAYARPLPNEVIDLTDGVVKQNTY